MRVLTTVVYFLSVSSLLAQDCSVSAGTKTLYAPQQVKYAKAPGGYHPVFINHVGRHGARHLTKDLNTTLAFKLLHDADSLHALSDDGIKLYKMVLLLQDIEAPGLKSISQRGKNELQAIAERMVKNNEAVFSGKAPVITVEITKELRTSQSADAFLKGLHRNTSGINKVIDDTALRFYDLSPQYLDFEENGKWKSTLSSLLTGGMSDDIQNFSGRFFSKSFSVSHADKMEFCKDVYGFAAIIPSITSEITRYGKSLADLDFKSMFSCKQLMALSLLDQAEDFLLKGPGSDTMGIQIKIAVPLLVQFINTSDEFLNGDARSVRLRFAHAETIAPFASLMQANPASKAVSSIENFHTSWKADKIIPLSANVQWVFYKKNNADDYLVRFLLNEKEVGLKGLHTSLFPFYRWKEVREFYTGLLRKLNVSLTEDMYGYLQHLK